jgi:Tfp pilus assembly protein PilO
MTTEKLGWFDYVLIVVVFIIVVVSLGYLFTFYKSDKSLNEKVENHETRLNRIDTLHLKYINEK